MGTIKLRVLQVSGLLLSLAPSSALATETITYTYDARGRLVKVVHAGSVNNAVQTDYTLDKASNRTKVKTTNAPN